MNDTRLQVVPVGELTKVSFNATAPTMKAIQIERPVLNHTEAINRALQTYAGIAGLGLWAAFRVVLSERAALRRIASRARGRGE